MKAKYWIEQQRRYVDYELPDGSSCYENDMDKIISCACCGKKVLYGDTYTLRRIHTASGFGYSVCGDCYYSGEQRRN